MNTDRAQVGWGFWFWWVLASIVGLASGFPVAHSVLSAGTVVGAASGADHWQPSASALPDIWGGFYETALTVDRLVR